MQLSIPSSSTLKHQHDDSSPLPLGMDWSLAPLIWEGRNSVWWSHELHKGWSCYVTIPSFSSLLSAASSSNTVGLKLHLDYSGVSKRRKGTSIEGGIMEFTQGDAWSTAYSTVAAGAALVAGLGMVAFLRRAGV